MLKEWLVSECLKTVDGDVFTTFKESTEKRNLISIVSGAQLRFHLISIFH